MNKTAKRLNTHFMPYPHESPRAETKEDGSEVHKFRFALPKGTLDLRMSGLELAALVVQHMAGIIGMRLLSYRPDVECEFIRLYNLLTVSPKQVLDELLPWIRTVKGTDDNDYVELNIAEKKPHADRKLIFDCGGAQ